MFPFAFAAVSSPLIAVVAVARLVAGVDELRGEGLWLVIIVVLVGALSLLLLQVFVQFAQNCFHFARLPATVFNVAFAFSAAVEFSISLQHR